MGYRVTFLAATFLLAATATLAQWDFDEGNTLVQGQPFGGKGLAVDSAGNAYVLAGISGDLYFQSRDAVTGNWSSLELVSDTTILSEITDAAIVWNSARNAPVITYEANHRIWFANRRLDEWTRIPLSMADAAAFAPDIGCNQNNAMYVVWVEEGDAFQLKCSFFNGDAWESSTIEAELGESGSGAAPRVAVDVERTGHIIFRGVVDGVYAAQYATNDTAGGETWTVTTLETPYTESYPGDIAVSADGHVHCVSFGADGIGNPRQALYNERDSLGVWSFGVSVSEDTYASQPRVALNSDYSPYCVWLEQSGDFFTGLLGYSTADYDWEVDLPYGDANGDVAFAIDGQDYGHILVNIVVGGQLYVRSEEPLVLPDHWPEIRLLPDTIVYDTLAVGELQAIMGWVHNTGEVDLELFRGYTIGEGFWGGGVLHLIGDNGPMIGTDIRFEPHAPGVFHGWWVVESTALTSPDSIFLLGVAVEDTTFTPEIRITPDRVQFDSVRIGEDSTMQVSLQNVGDGTLTVTEFFVEGNSFYGPEWSAQEIEPNSLLQVEVRFAPTELHRHQGYIMIYSNAVTSPDSIPMEGFGIENLSADDNPLPLAFELKPLYPNPFNGAVNVSFTLPHASEMTLRVYDVLGRKVGVIANGVKQAGLHSTQWNCAECAAGIYLFKLEAAGQTFVQKAVFVK